MDRTGPAHRGPAREEPRLITPWAGRGAPDAPPFRRAPGGGCGKRRRERTLTELRTLYDDLLRQRGPGQKHSDRAHSSGPRGIRPFPKGGDSGHGGDASRAREWTEAPDPLTLPREGCHGISSRVLARPRPTSSRAAFGVAPRPGAQSYRPSRRSRPQALPPPLCHRSRSHGRFLNCWGDRKVHKY